MRYMNWFYSDQDEDTVKSVSELMGLYYYSVGRGCNMLLNIGPDRRGLLPDADAERLLEFGAEIRRRFEKPFATLADCTADGNVWAYKPKSRFMLNHVVVAEDIAKGEHVRSFVIKAAPAPYGDPIVVYEGRNIGHKAICEFPPMVAREVTLEVSEADGDVSLKTLNFHNVE